MILIIDYGMGNSGSILNMLKKIGKKAKIASHPNEVMPADKIILPGIGSFDHGMRNLEDSGFRDVLEEFVIQRKKPIFGICLGMQLMTQSSEEGTLDGLGWINAEVKKFRFEDTSVKVPHMGWNLIDIRKKSPLFIEIHDEARFYFVHSYYVDCEDQGDVLTVTNYGHEFISSFQRLNIIGVQFHPEKSHKFGMKMFENFSDWNSNV